MPVNKGANQDLDCAVIKYLHETNRKVGDNTFDTIRSTYKEGGEVYPSSNFTERLHLEICVINPNLIRVYFLPGPVYEFNPYLN